MRQFLDRLSYLSFLHVTSGYVLANLFLIQSSKKDFVVVGGAWMISWWGAGGGRGGEVGGTPGLLVTPVCPRPLSPILTQPLGARGFKAFRTPCQSKGSCNHGSQRQSQDESCSLCLVVL